MANHHGGHNQPMTEAVIVALGRSPIGRARKGSLVDVRPDDLAAHVVTKVLEKVPELDRGAIEDLICGCGLPGGEQGYNIGRVISILARLDVPGVTVNRYCSSSLMTTRTVGAQNSGFFAREITPVPLPSGGRFTKDDGPRPGTTVEVLATLKPAFREDGTVTAGNACPLNDGAAAVVVMSDRKAKELGLKPVARIVSTGLSALEPEFMGLGPIDASRQALARAKMNINDIDIVHINEAFAAQGIPSARAIGVDPFSDNLNPHGGAIALGHPFGMTGARILCTLLNDLREKNKTYALETLCVGGGQGMAMIVERLN